MPRYTFERDGLEVMGVRDVAPLLIWAIFDSREGRSNPIGYMRSAEHAQRVCDALNQQVQ